MIKNFIALFIHLLTIIISTVTPVLINIFVIAFVSTTLALGSTQPVGAVGENEPYETINWSLTSYNDGSATTRWYLRGDTNLIDNTNSIKITLPDSYTYLTNNTVAFRSYIKFYDAGDNVLDTIYLEDINDYIIMDSLQGSVKYNYYDFDLEKMGLYNVGIYGDPYRFEFRVYLHEDVNGWGSTNRDTFLAYIQSEYDYQVFFETPDYRNHWFNMESSYYDTGVEYVYKIPPTTGALTIYYDGLDMDFRNIFTNGTDKSYIQFYDGLDLTDFYYLEDYFYFVPGSPPLFNDGEFGVFIPFPTDYTLGEYTHYRLYIYTDEMSYINMYELNSGLDVVFSSYFIDVEFIIDDVVDSTQTIRYDQLITEPTTPTKAGYRFLGWYLPSSSVGFRPSLFDFDNFVDPTTTNAEGKIRLYAKFDPLQITDVPDTTDPTPVTGNILTVLSGLGLSGDSGRTLFYMVIMSIALIISMFKGVGGIATIIIGISITSIFSFLGFLPMLVVVLSYTGLFASALAVFTLGGATNE